MKQSTKKQKRRSSRAASESKVRRTRRSARRIRVRAGRARDRCRFCAPSCRLRAQHSTAQLRSCSAVQCCHEHWALFAAEASQCSMLFSFSAPKYCLLCREFATSDLTTAPPPTAAATSTSTPATTAARGSSFSSFSSPPTFTSATLSGSAHQIR